MRGCRGASGTEGRAARHALVGARPVCACVRACSWSRARLVCLIVLSVVFVYSQSVSSDVCLCCPVHAHIVLHLPPCLVACRSRLSVSICLSTVLQSAVSYEHFIFSVTGLSFRIFSSQLLSCLKLCLHSDFPRRTAVGCPVCLCHVQSLSTPLLCFLPAPSPLEPLPVPAADYLSE